MRTKYCVKDLLKSRRIKSTLLLVVAFLLSPVVTMAQDLPCNNGDPYDNCVTPLDTWVIVLVVLALFFGYRQIQKQKSFAA